MASFETIVPHGHTNVMTNDGLLNTEQAQIKVIFVDDDRALVGLAAEFCKSHGIDVIWAGDAAVLEELLAARTVDLILLDVGLPGEDGFSICRRLRVTRPGLPIIVVSGRTDDMDRILGLELGADDYITKPFVPRELVARIRSLHRRSQLHTMAPAQAATECVPFGQFELDLGRRELRRQGEPQPLTNAEYDLLAVLCQNPGQALSRAEILNLIEDGGESTASERGIDVTIVKLRKLIEDEPKSPKYIKTVWGIGYIFTP